MRVFYVYMHACICGKIHAKEATHIRMRWVKKGGEEKEEA